MDAQKIKTAYDQDGFYCPVDVISVDDGRLRHRLERPHRRDAGEWLHALPAGVSQDHGDGCY